MARAQAIRAFLAATSVQKRIGYPSFPDSAITFDPVANDLARGDVLVGVPNFAERDDVRFEAVYGRKT